MDVGTTTVGSDLKFRLVREDFADAVAWVARSLPTRPPSNPVLAGVLITGSDDGLTIAGFDFDVSAEALVPAEIASAGTVLVSGRLLSDITRALPAKPVDVSVDGSRMLLVCGSAKFSLPAMPVEDYPALPALPDETGVVAADLFTEAVGQVAEEVLGDDARDEEGRDDEPDDVGRSAAMFEEQCQQREAQGGAHPLDEDDGGQPVECLLRR